MKSVLITGGTGAFGQAFTETLLRDGLATRICIYSRSEYKQFCMRQRFNDDGRLRFFIGDVRDRWRLQEAMRGCDVAVHGAALKRVEACRYNPWETILTNIHGAKNVIEAAQAEGVQKVVALSTDKAFEPLNESPYGLTKALAELLFASARDSQRATRFALCRYGNVWGSTGSVGPVWSRMLEDGEEYVPISDGECTRYFMRMSEAVRLVLDTLRDMPTEIQIPELPAYRLGDLAEAMGAKTVTVGLPKWEKLHESMDENNCSKNARRMSIEELRKVI